MKIKLIAVGTRMPGWVTEAYHDYARRLPRECGLSLTEIRPSPCLRSAPADRAVEQECKRLWAATLPDQRVIALDVGGRSWSTPQLAEQMRLWMHDGRDVVLLIGGPDGLADGCLQRAEQRWSLSTLTLPHALVRVLVAEQLYRAWSIISGHPYHRA